MEVEHRKIDMQTNSCAQGVTGLATKLKNGNVRQKTAWTAENVEHVANDSQHA